MPALARRPVGYARDFLDDYVPNVTVYLSDPTRAHLHTIGRTPDTTRPAGTFARHLYQRLLIDLS